MLEALLLLPEASAIISFVLLFHGGPSIYFWVDEAGACHCIHQGEGGEQGDGLMPLLYALGQHAALESIGSQLIEGERLCVFLDGLYIVCDPSRVVTLFNIAIDVLWNSARIHVHQSKKKVWNRSGDIPRDVENLGVDVWKGD